MAKLNKKEDTTYVLELTNDERLRLLSCLKNRIERSPINGILFTALIDTLAGEVT